MSKKPLSMQICDLERKIIARRRGGVCYELNGLFFHLLRRLEYDAHLAAATTYAGNRWNPYEGTHMMIVVQMDNQYYAVDVGFGGNSPSKPIPLNGEEVQDVDGVLRVVQEDGTYFLQKKEDRHWDNLYRIRLDEKQMDDFTHWCQFVQTSPDSPFNKTLLVSRVTNQGRATLSGNSLTVVENGIKRKSVVPANEITVVLQQRFNLYTSQA
jgi:N-hydroxyarylamine O-acetyltransferase